jgi:hypothetical protein
VLGREGALSSALYGHDHHDEADVVVS